jgi:DNA-binding transcriptional ArsR family regulator
MRKKSVIEAILPPTRREILATLLLEPGRSWYLSDLAGHLGRRNPSSLQRELESLVAAGVVVRRQEGNRVYFQSNRACPVYPELLGLLAKTTGLAEVVREALAGLAKRIRVAFIHGSIARSEEHATSDVDLMIIGDVGLAEVSLALRAAENQLSRSVNASIYTAAEFSAKVTARHHYLATVIEREKVFLIGSEHELEELASGRPAAEPCDEQAGTG